MAVIRLPKPKPKAPKRKPGEKAGLSRDMIVAKTLELMATNSDLSMITIAKALKVAPGAVYAHFPGKLSEILTEMARTVMAEVARPFHPTESWEGYMRDLFVAAGKALHGNRRAAAFVGNELTANYYLNPILVERILLALDVAGVPEASSAKALDLVMSNLIGFILIECFVTDAAPQWIEKQSNMIDALSSAEHPQIKALKHDLLKAATDRFAPIGGEEPSPAKAQRYADHLIAGLKAQIAV